MLYLRLFIYLYEIISFGGVGGTVASESALRSAGTLLSRVRAPPPAPWPDGGPESLRSPCWGLAIYKTQPSNLLSFILTDYRYFMENKLKLLATY
ncbi:acetylcholine receptor subunit alpha [Plakobranchus ocellatus]|uniref:Acetylcholine receptor subunit alpha n=1 Tax=Plakobranchus ocellatus TaxID=259542 RepID=A0AAV4DLY8_9GAST|nr:acetylcholine receptor subunit alpha [Plakobranchus ocellatus]